MINIQNLSNFILKNINLSIKKGEFFVLLGPNGAGKTSLLNAITGFCNYKGTISIDRKAIEKTPIEKRQIGYVFQELCLFPHMNVYDNIAFGLKVQREKHRERVGNLLDLLNLGGIVNRYPYNLSGGEKQKVALARALAIDPKIILMDEPLNKLDYNTANYLRDELKKVQKTMGITTVYVTHDYLEARILADRIAVLNNGNIEQIGTQEEIFYHPRTPFVAKFLGINNIFEGKVIEDNNEITKFLIKNTGLIITTKSNPAFRHKKQSFLCIHPERLSLNREPQKANHFLISKIIDIKDRGPLLHITVDIKGLNLNIILSKATFSLENRYVCFSLDASHLIQRE